MQRCIVGDRRAQYQLYKQYVKPLYHTVIRLVPVVPEAEDILQESFISIFKHLDRYRAESNLMGWMRRIVINKSLDFIRKKKERWMVPIESTYELAHEEDTDDESSLIVERLHKEIKNLPDGCRVVLALHLFEGYKHAEIARQLNISESTSKTQYHRAKKLLHSALLNHKQE